MVTAALRTCSAVGIAKINSKHNGLSGKFSNTQKNFFSNTKFKGKIKHIIPHSGQNAQYP